VLLSLFVRLRLFRDKTYVYNGVGGDGSNENFELYTLTGKDTISLSAFERELDSQPTLTITDAAELYDSYSVKLDVFNDTFINVASGRGSFNDADTLTFQFYDLMNNQWTLGAGRGPYYFLLTVYDDTTEQFIYYIYNGGGGDLKPYTFTGTDIISLSQFEKSTM
jgi:hypothetical protein